MRTQFPTPVTSHIDPVTGYNIALPVTLQGEPFWWERDAAAYDRIKKMREQLGIVVDDEIPDDQTRKNLELAARAARMGRRRIEPTFRDGKTPQDVSGPQNGAQGLPQQKKIDRHGVPLAIRVMTMEEKSVRHVRTPAGSRKYGQPIGSVIVRDGAAPLKHLEAVRNDFPGWEKLKGADGKHYYIGKDPNNPKVWVATNSNDEVLHEGNTEEAVYRALDNEISKVAGPSLRGSGGTDTGSHGGRTVREKPAAKPVAKPAAKKPATPKAPAAHRKPPERRPDDPNFVVPPGFRRATEKERNELTVDGKKAIPPQWGDVVINEDKNAGLIALGTDAAGRRQYVYSSEHKERQKAAKFQRVKELMKHVMDLDRALRKDWKTSDDAACLLLVRDIGLRPGSRSETKARVQAYGATTLQVRHVHIGKDGETAYLNYIGKGGKQIKQKTKDPDVVAMLKKYTAGKAPSQDLFTTNEKRLNDLIKKHTKAAFVTKDLRTLRANIIALERIRHTRNKPKNKAQFIAFRNKVADEVAAQLGNTRTMALSSYIDPSVFDKLVLDPAWLKKRGEA